MRLFRSAVLLLVCGTLAVLPACAGASDPVSAPPGPTPPAARPEDLADVLVQPDGYQAMPQDTLSGPLSSVTDLRGLFTTHPGDADEIAKNGFAAGYARYWRQAATGSVTSSEFPLRANAYGIVLQFGTADGAERVLTYFRQRNTEDRYTFFPVPESLPGGFGDYLVQPGDPQNPTTYTYGIAWRQENRVFNTGISYFTQPGSPTEVIAHAMAQAHS